jgi:hypothetical protein
MTYKKGDTIYERESGSRIVLDKIVGEGFKQEIYAHVVDENNVIYPSQLLDNLLSHGYWEAVTDDSADKSADIEKNNPNRDSKGRFTFGAGGPQGGGAAGGGAGSEAGGGSGGAGAEAEQAGQAEPYEETDNYRMQHQPLRRSDEFGSPATNIGDEMMPGFYENPNLYGSGYAQADKESRSVLMSIRDKPNAPVTIYRTVPEGVDKINPGDWVTLSPSYAKEHLRSNVLGGKVLSQVIPAKDLWFDGNSINEFGYDPVD